MEINNIIELIKSQTSWESNKLIAQLELLDAITRKTPRISLPEFKKPAVVKDLQYRFSNAFEAFRAPERTPAEVDAEVQRLLDTGECYVIQ